MSLYFFNVMRGYTFSRAIAVSIARSCLGASLPLGLVAVVVAVRCDE